MGLKQNYLLRALFALSLALGPLLLNQNDARAENADQRALSISNGQASNDATAVTYQYRYTGRVKYFHVYIDTDQSYATGYKIGGIGAEYIIENGRLYKYIGTGNNWVWTYLGPISSFSTSSGIAKFTVARSAIGETAPIGESSDLLYNIDDGNSHSLSLPKLTQHYADTILTPQIDRFELVANDGLQAGSYPYVSNDWGGHMSRIVRTKDGTIYLLRLKMSPTQTPAWALIKKDPVTGNWSDVVSGSTSDEAHLLRNPVSDTVYVIAHPNGLPAIWTGPSFTQQAIPGAWQQLPDRSRHYGNAGIGADGTVCLKASHEFNVAPPTSVTNTEYACATSSSSGKLSWKSLVVHPIGDRHAYDYIFPSVVRNGFYGSSQSDLYKDAAGYPMLAGFPYVFDGVRGYSSGISNDSRWRQGDVHPPLSVPSPPTATVAPYVRQIEAFIDSKNRAFSIAYKESTDGNTPLQNLGPYLSVNNPVSGAGIYYGKLNLPTYGYSRIVEDAKGQLWLLWTNLGTRLTQIVVYRVVETVTNGATTFSLGQSYDLSGTFAQFSPGWSYTPYAIYGEPYLAVPRGGTPRSNSIEGYINACTVQFSTPDLASRPPYNSSQCFNADNTGQMSVIYFRLRLPD